MAKNKEVALLQKQNERLMKMVAEARERCRNYEKIANVHSAYISILLKRLGATKDNMVTITASEVKEAMDHHEARVTIDGDTYNLYCEVAE